MADAKKPLHPAQAISNIKTYLPITFEVEKGLYSTWAELFKVNARAFQVLDHIIPPSTSDKTTLSEFNKTAWNHVDAIVLTWI